MKLFLLAILLCGSSRAAGRFTAKASGNWNNAATWGGSQIPGNHDAVSIQDGVTVTVSDARIVGLSEPNGSVAIDFGNTGALIIVSGGMLRVRGDLQWASGIGGNLAPYLTVQAGGTLEFDSSQAVRPKLTKYKSHPDTAYGYRPVVTTGTARNHAIVRSNSGGGNGYFALGGGTGGSYSLIYTDFLRIGDSGNPAFTQWSPGGKTSLTPWISIHNSFTSCGLAPAAAGSLNPADIFRHDYNAHTGSLGAAVMSRGGTSPPLGAGGIREIVGNVFDIQADGGFDGMSFTIHSNYFQQPMVMVNTSTAIWALFQNNFYRVTVPYGNAYISMLGDLMDNIFFLDGHTVFNPHGPAFTASAGQKASGNISDHAGQITANGMSAFLIPNGAQAANGAYSVLNNILLPNAAGSASFWITAAMQQTGMTGVKFTVNHNTAIITGGLNGGPALLTAHATTLPNPPGQLVSYANNILWNPTTATKAYKLFASQNVNLNICAPANCDHNDGWNLLSDGGGFSGGANGYADNFNGGTPGSHDLSVDPLFVDPTRNVVTFDSAYLGNRPAAWSSASSYNVGDMVSSADPSIYSSTALGFPATGAVINYRYTNGSFSGANCGGANPKPGLLADPSRACWEWASLYRLRQGVAAQTLYEDVTIGVYGNDIITTLLQWIRSGYSPSRSTLALAGSDGQDIGAVPVTLPATAFPQ